MQICGLFCSLSFPPDAEVVSQSRPRLQQHALHRDALEANGFMCYGTSPCLLARLQGYLDGSCCYLDVMEAPQSALSVNEVRGCQLVQGFQGDCGIAPTTSCQAASFRFPTELALVHKNGQGLFSCKGMRHSV